MPVFQPLSLFLPHTPQNQVMRSLEDYTPQEITALMSDQKEGFIHIIQPEPKTEDKNLEIRRNWINALNNQLYTPQKKTGVFWYKIKTQGLTFQGLIGACSALEFKKRTITQHEKVYEHRVQLMADYLETVRIQAEPVVVIHEEALDSKIDFIQIEKRTTVFDFQYEQTHHQMWELNRAEIEQLMHWSIHQPHFHLADGHHRVASMLHYSHQKQKPAPISCYLIHQSQLELQSFVWFLKTCKSKDDLERLVEQIKLHQGKQIDLNAAESKRFEITVKVGKTYYGFEGDFSNPPAFINGNLLAPLPHLAEALQYQPDPKQGVDSAKWEDFELAFFMKPISKAVLFDLARKGKNLPAKSTYILPKLLTGLFVSPIE